MATQAVGPSNSAVDPLSHLTPPLAPSLPKTAPPTTPAPPLAPPSHRLPLCSQEVVQAYFLHQLVLHSSLLAPPLLRPLILCRAWLRPQAPPTLLNCPTVHLSLVLLPPCHPLPSLLRPLTLCCSGRPTSTQPPRCHCQGNSRMRCRQEFWVITRNNLELFSLHIKFFSFFLYTGCRWLNVFFPSGSTLPRVLPLSPPLRVEALFSHSPSSSDRAERGERAGSCLLSFLPGDIISLLISEPRDGWHYGQNERTGR